MACVACVLAWALGAAVCVLVLLLAQQPVVPGVLSAPPSLPFVYLQLLRSALRRKRARASLKGTPIRVALAAPLRADATRYAAFLRLAGFKDVPGQLPASYPCVEAFRLTLLAMSHAHFPFSVLGAVLARNSSSMARPLRADEPLHYTAEVLPDFVRNDKGDTEVCIVSTATDAAGRQVWRNVLTVIVINPQRRRGGGGGASGPPAPQGPARPDELPLLTEFSVAADAGRAYGALSGDRNPIHLHALASRLFGFKRPIAHALYLVACLEAAVTNAGLGLQPSMFPMALETEFKRPTLLPARLRAVARRGAGQQELPCAVLTSDGKPVIIGRVLGQVALAT